MITESLERFLIARASLSKRTLEFYKDNLQRYAGWIQAAGCAGDDWLNPEVIEEFLADEGRRVGPHTVHGRYRALSAFYGWLRKRRYIPTNPMIDIDAPRTPKQAPRRARASEVTQLLDSIAGDTWIDARDRLAIRLLFFCGLRVSECAALELTDFDLEEKLLHVRATTTKANRDRFVPLLGPVVEAFNGYLVVRPAWPTDKVFLSADGGYRQPMGTLTRFGIWQLLRRRCKAAGVRDLNPHAFRHGLAMYLLNQGGDMSLVQRILGHSRITTTSESYASWETEAMAREFARHMSI